MIAIMLGLALAIGLTGCARPKEPPLQLVECAGRASLLTNPGNPCDHPVLLMDRQRWLSAPATADDED